MPGIYCIKSKSTNLILVGQTKQSFLKRKEQHFSKLKKNKHDNPYLQNYFNKYGIDDLEFLILEETLDLDKKEIYWINNFKSLDRSKGFNLREGGGRGEYGKDLKNRVKEGIKNSKRAQLVKKEQAEKQALTWIFISPLGEKVTFKNLRKFCRDNNLSQQSMWFINKQKKYSHKGWKPFLS